jgi:uncharacterized phage protein (TIGR01671 family)|nr:MAG TPA: YopX protein [Caudoviricetes sp.]
MREILFRGKDVREQWHCGLLAHIGNAWFISNKAGIATAIEVIPCTIGQYTGLTDKNGKKIFEGDIVAYCTSSNRATNKEFHEVVFETRGESGYFGIKISKIETWGFCIEVPAKLMEVIGNIHDNPELLEA